MINNILIPRKLIKRWVKLAKQHYPNEILIFFSGNVNGQTAMIESWFIDCLRRISELAVFIDYQCILRHIKEHAILGYIHSHTNGSIWPSSEDYSVLAAIGGQVVGVMAFESEHKVKVQFFDYYGNVIPVNSYEYLYVWI